jgi:hypothetical protein
MASPNTHTAWRVCWTLSSGTEVFGTLQHEADLASKGALFTLCCSQQPIMHVLVKRDSHEVSVFVAHNDSYLLGVGAELRCQTSYHS